VVVVGGEVVVEGYAGLEGVEGRGVRLAVGLSKGEYVLQKDSLPDRVEVCRTSQEPHADRLDAMRGFPHSP
jgi:hypothetical protein